MAMNLNAVNQLTQGSVLYSENEPITSVCVILKGRVAAYNNGTKIMMGSGSFIGVSDLHRGRYGSTYVAFDNLVFYVFNVTKREELRTILSANKDYSGLMIYSLIKNIVELNKIYTALTVYADSIYEFINVSYSAYKEFGRTCGHKTVDIDMFESIEKYQSDIRVNRSRLAFYNECVKVPVEAQKQYYSYSTPMADYQVDEMALLIEQMNEECSSIAFYISGLFEGLICENEVCFFKVATKLAIDVAASGGQNGKLVAMVDEAVEQINKIEKLFTERVGVKLKVDRVKMEEIYFILLTGSGDSEVSTEMQLNYSEQDMNQAIELMNGSLRKITTYAGLEEEKVVKLEKWIHDFSNLRDKLAADDTVRLIRKNITEVFYELYQTVFIKAYKNREKERIIDLFLKYGFIDENLLSKEQLIELYYLKDEDDKKGPCHVYNIKDWLIQIFEGKKEPSKNEFDLDYAEAFRELKRSQAFTPEQERDYFSDPYKKLDFEIKNVFRYNNRLVSGQITAFVPILYREGFINDIKKIYLTTQLINDTVKEVLKVDYSAFHREAVYYDEEKGIKREYIMKQVFPDIILLPTVGNNGIMWQDITGKKRDTSGRFLLPSFMETSIEDTMIRLIGKFRWELCRTIQGPAWNSIAEKSLTSEYVDYIQFYRKNKELSEERKQKLKAQIQKGRNNSREIFVIDYFLWIKNEANGALRLNKVARAILATYCPFSKPIRLKLSTQPLFEEAMAKQSRETAKKVKELDLRMRALQKDGIAIPSEISETFEFYNEL